MFSNTPKFCGRLSAFPSQVKRIRKNYFDIFLRIRSTKKRKYDPLVSYESYYHTNHT